MSFHVAPCGVSHDTPSGVHRCRAPWLSRFLRVPDAEIRFSRFSINAIGFFGAEKAALGEDFYAPDNNEEEWLSACLPALTGRHGKIFGDLIAAHFSYYTQENAMLQTNILES